MHSAVGGLKQALAAVIKRVGIMRRNQDRRSPLKAMLQVGRSVRVGKLRLLGDRLYLPNVPVVARDVSLIVRGINNIRVARIRRDIPSLAAADVVPVAAVDRSIVAAACDRDSARVLLR